MYIFAADLPTINPKSMFDQCRSRFPGILLTLIIACGLVVQTVHGQETILPSDPALKALVDQSRSKILAAADELAYPGVSVGLSIDGEVVWVEGFRYADIENGIEVTPASLFRIGSISKPLTATAVAQLVSDGRLDVDLPVQTYVPSFPEKPWPITTRQLGGHLAGIRHYQGNEFMSDKAYASVTEGLTIFQDDSLLFEPGTRYRYTSYGWNLISAIVESASGEEFLPYMDDHVFDPLGMNDTQPDWVAVEIPNRVGFYERTADGQPTIAPYVDNSYKWAGGGFLSHPTDLLAFGNAMLGDDFLQPTGRALLFTEQSTTDGTKTGYGFGWSISVDDRGRLLLGHTGGSVGGTSLLTTNPNRDVVFVMLINQSGANLAVGRVVMQDVLNMLEGQ